MNQALSTSLLPLVVLATLVGGCNFRNENADRDRDVEGESLLAVHERIDHTVKYVKHATWLTADGRLRIQVVMSSKSGKDLPVILTTQWYDQGGAVIEESTPRPMIIPTGGTLVFEDSSYTQDAVSFNVSVRPMETSRKS